MAGRSALDFGRIIAAALSVFFRFVSFRKGHYVRHQSVRREFLIKRR